MADMIPHRLAESLQAYLQGRLELRSVLDQTLVAWRDKGWGVSTDLSSLAGEQRTRAEVFQAELARLVESELKRGGHPRVPPDVNSPGHG
jgi:hypothetical protein